MIIRKRTFYRNGKQVDRYQLGELRGGWWIPASGLLKSIAAAQAEAAELGRTVDRIITD